MRAVLILATVFSSTLGQIEGDMNCTQGAGATATYTDQATICPNVYSDTACDQLFNNPPPAPLTAFPAPGSSVPRAFKCYSTDTAAGATYSQEMKNAAVANCPKYCGYCCQTPAYNCKNAPYPRLNCASITNPMCQSPTWRQTISEDCPSACGFCLLDGCIDTAPDCATQPQICVTRGMESFVATNCQRTCGLCATATTAASGVATTRGSTGSCASAVDTNANCANWVKNGFCSSTFYTADQKKSYCAKSCNLC